MFDWGRIWLIAKRELTTRFRQRSYRITLVIQLLVAAGAALAPIGIAYFTDGEGSGDASVIVVDEADAGAAERMARYLAAGESDALPSIEVLTDATSADDARSRVEDGDVGYAVIVSGDPEEELAYEVVSENGSTSTVEGQRILGAVTSFSVEQMAEARGLTAEEAQRLVAAPEIRVQDVSGEEGSGIEEMLADSSSAEYGVAYIGSILIYMAIILYGTWVATGVAEEKGSRIMEIMVNAATPRDLMVGKVLGIMLAGLAQLIPMLLVAGVLFSQQPRIAEALGVELTPGLSIDFAAISVKAVSAFLLYFLLGFILYGGFYAGIGSMVSRQEEVNQAVAPMMTLVVISFFAAVVTLAIPDSLFAKVLFLIPISSPFVALPRILLGTPTPAEIALSLGILAVSGIGAMWLASRFYRVGVLMYGQRPGWKSMVRMSRMQKVAR